MSFTRSRTPFKPVGGIAVLKGNLAPDGAVVKPSAASPALMKHTGRAVVFESIEDLRSRINDDALDIDEHCVMVLKNCGPKGYPGMAEVGNLPIPPKILKRGITDMVRISDARMSGTAYGTVVLHCCSRSGCRRPARPRAEWRSDLAGCRSTHSHLQVEEDELERRRQAWQPPAACRARVHQAIYRSRSASERRSRFRFSGWRKRFHRSARQFLKKHRDNACMRSSDEDLRGSSC